MTTKYYHKNSDVVAFERVEAENGFWTERAYDERGNVLTYKDSDGYWSEKTYDERGNELTYKNSNGHFKIEYKKVTEEKFNKFIKNQNRPCAGKKVVIDGIEYELK